MSKQEKYELDEKKRKEALKNEEIEKKEQESAEEEEERTGLFPAGRDFKKSLGCGG